MAIPMDSSSLPSLSSLPSSPLPPNAFAQLVSTEKEYRRHWLRGEMISLVDPLIESLFDKLASRFASCSPTTEDSLKTSSDAVVGGGANDGKDDGRHQEMMMTTHHHHQNTQHHLESPIVQPLPNVNTFYPSEGAFKLNQHLSHILTNSQSISFTNELTANVVPSQPIKEDSETLSKTTNEPIPEGQGQGQNWSVADDVDDEEEEECECDDCMNGGIDYIKLEEDDDDGILIDSDDEENDESSTHHLVAKKPRITKSESQLQNANKPKCTRLQQITDQPNQIGEQIATLQLKCHLDHCPQLFTGKNELTSHMFRIHLIRQCRCLVKDCKQSFDNQSNLSRHIKKFHNQFTCHKCVKHFTTYNHLSVHNNLYHNLGLYGCSYPSCSFTGEFKQKVYGHFKTNHKAEEYCQQPDCDYRTTNRAKLKEHSRAHLGIKPYRCRWNTVTMPM